MGGQQQSYSQHNYNQHSYSQQNFSQQTSQQVVRYEDGNQSNNRRTWDMMAAFYHYQSALLMNHPQQRYVDISVSNIGHSDLVTNEFFTGKVY